jgi:hypothetical protein
MEEVEDVEAVYTQGQVLLFGKRNANKGAFGMLKGLPGVFLVILNSGFRD